MCGLPYVQVVTFVRWLRADGWGHACDVDESGRIMYARATWQKKQYPEMFFREALTWVTGCERRSSELGLNGLSQPSFALPFPDHGNFVECDMSNAFQESERLKAKLQMMSYEVHSYTNPQRKRKPRIAKDFIFGGGYRVCKSKFNVQL